MTRTKNLLSSFIVAFALLLPIPAFAQGAGLTLACPALPLVVQSLIDRHMSYDKSDTRMKKRVAGLYAEQLDPTKVMLTEKEFTQLEKRLYALIQETEKRECSEIEAVHKDQLKWHEEIESYVRKTLEAKDFKLDKDLELEVDIEKRKRPTNAKEQKALRDAVIQFQLANLVAGGITVDEAKKKLIHRYELNTKRVKEQDKPDLYRTYLNAYALALDPHSTYFSPEDLEDFKIQMGLSLTGIGAALTSRDGYTIVQEVIPGGPADKQGKLRPKDKIIAVTQGRKGEPVDVIDMDLRDVVRKIRGEKGTWVVLTILRQGEDTERFDLAIKRDEVDLKEQAAKLSYREVKRGKETLKLAIIDLPSFYSGQQPGARDSAQDVKRLVLQAKKEKADGIVLDLSRNGGGALQSAVEISGFFIERGAIVGVGVPGQKPEVLSDRDPRVQWDGPLVVLTSKISASASEILAGALQDYDRAIIVGDTHTFGKGTVQQLSPLPPGLGLLKVTTSLFFLPEGESTQQVGVQTDIVVPSVFSALDIGERYQKFSLPQQKVKDFESPSANANATWKRVDRKLIPKLAKLSKARMAADADFKELQADLAKVKKDDTRMKISEILDDDDKKDDEDDDSDEKDEKELSIQTKEAAEILADFIVHSKK
jgi:carboxyl-terminal processing protease